MIARIRREEAPDAGAGRVRGLYLITQISGVQSWAFRYRFNGRPLKLTLGKAPEIPRKQARLLAMEAHLSVAKGIDPGEAKRTAREANRRPVELDRIELVTAAFLKRHVAALSVASRKEAANYMAAAVKAWPGRRLSSISKAEINHHLDSIIDRGSPVAANRWLAWFKGMCNWAIGRGILAANPCLGVISPAKETARERAFSDDELVTILRAADTLGFPYAQFVRLLALSGQRVAEVFNLVWSEVDLDRAVWNLPAERSKNGKAHEIPLSGAAVDLLRSMPRIADAVFTANGRNSIKGVSRLKRRLDALLPDLPAWQLRDLRRTFSTGCARLNVQLPLVEKLLNHTSGTFAGVQGVYQRHSLAAEKVAAMETWARHIETIMSGETAAVLPLRGRAKG